MGRFPKVKRELSIPRSAAYRAALRYRVGTGVAQYQGASQRYTGVVSVISAVPFITLSTRFIREFSSAESLVRSSTFRVARSGTELAAVPPFEIM